MEIIVSRRTLTDNSYVYDVVIGALSVPAITERHAHELAEKIADAITSHTTDEGRVLFNY